MGWDVGEGCTTQTFFWNLIGHEFAFYSDILPLNHISSALKILNRDGPSPKDSARHSRRAHGPGNVDFGFLSKIKVRPSPARLGFWNLNSGPTDSNPSKSRAEFAGVRILLRAPSRILEASAAVKERI